MSGIDRAAEALREAERVIVITGAGISAESGIPTFRGPGGLWEGFRAEELATPQAFAADADRVWRWYRWRRVKYRECPPNPGHHVIATMESAYPEFLVATQNVDGLHREAGNTKLVELHGSIDKMRCTACEAFADFPTGLGEPGEAVPLCEACGAKMRPHILWFGETYWPGVLEEVERAATRAQVALVVGTSAQVWPPVAMALLAKRTGAFLIDVNPARTQLSAEADVHLVGPSGTLLPDLWEAVGR